MIELIFVGALVIAFAVLVWLAGVQHLEDIKPANAERLAQLRRDLGVEE